MHSAAMDEELLLMVLAACAAAAAIAFFNLNAPSSIDSSSSALALWLSSLAMLSASESGSDSMLDVLLESLAQSMLSRPQLNYGSFLPADDLYTQYSQNPALFKSFTNLFPPEFDDLFDKVREGLCQPVDIRGNRRALHNQGQPRVVGPSGRPVGRPPKLSLQTRLMVWLGVLRGGMPLIDQIALCGQNQAGLSDDFYHILACVMEGLDDQIRWPDAAERQGLEGSFYDFPASAALVPILIVDGTTQEVHKPGDGSEPLMYCSRKSMHCWNHQIFVDWRGCIRAVYTSFVGSAHDSMCYRMLPQYQEKDLYFSGKQTVLADSGYVGCGIMHMRKGVVIAAERAFNSKARRHRVLVEFVIGAVKNKFGILSKAWPRGAHIQHANDTFFVCCQLLNFIMARRGYLRGAAYQSRGELEVWERRLLQHPDLHGRQWDADDCIFEMILEGRADDLYALL